LGAWLGVSVAYAFFKQLAPKVEAANELMFTTMGAMDIFVISMVNAMIGAAFLFIPVMVVFFIIETLIVRVKRIPAVRPIWWKYSSLMSLVAAIVASILYVSNNKFYPMLGLIVFLFIYAAVKLITALLWGLVDGAFPRETNK